MGGFPVFMLFDFDSPTTLSHDATMTTLCATIIRQAECNFAPEYGDFISTIPGAEHPATVQRVWRQALTEAHPVAVAFRQHDVWFRIGFPLPNYYRFYVMFDTGPIGGNDPALAAEKAQAAQTISALTTIIYQTLHPVYGRGLITPDADERPFAEATGAAPHVYAIYDYNVYGPALVARLGRQKLLAIPTWHTRTFADGGMLLAMARNPAAEWHMYQPNYRAAADSLGVATFFQCGTLPNW